MAFFIITGVSFNWWVSVCLPGPVVCWWPSDSDPERAPATSDMRRQVTVPGKQSAHS